MIFVDAEPGRGPLCTSFPTPKRPVVGTSGVVIVPPEQPHGFVSSGDVRPRQIDVHLSPRFDTTWLESSKRGVDYE